MNDLFHTQPEKSLSALRENFRVVALDSQEASGAHPVRSYLAFLKRWKWMLLLLSVAGCTTGYAVTLLQTPKYEARTTLEIETLNDAFLDAKQFIPVSAGDASGNTYSEIQTQLKVLQSDSMTGPVVQRLLTRGAKQYQVAGALGWLQKPPFRTEDPRALFHDELFRLAHEFEARGIGQTRIVELTADSAIPQLAVDFLNGVAAEFIKQSTQWRRDMGVRTTESLARLLQEDRRRVRESGDAMQEYARQSGLLYASTTSNVAQDKLAKIQDELSKAEAARMAAQARYETARKNTPETLPDELTTAALREAKLKLTQVQAQLAENNGLYTPEYPKSKKLASQILALQKAVTCEGANIAKKTEAAYRQALQNESLLSAEYNTQSALVADLGQRSVQYDLLKQEVEANQKGYEEMLKRVQEAAVAATVHADGARVIDHALLPDVPSSPKPTLSSALGGICFLIAGLAFAVVRDGTDSRIREPGVVEFGQFGVEQLGVVPHAKRPALHLPEPSTDEEFSPVAESYRAVVTSLTSFHGGDRPKILTVTSPGVRDGKTTVTANLAFILAAIGNRVLVVDADLRRGRLHEIFAVDNVTGFKELLGQDGAALQFIKESGIPGLKVLPSGSTSVGSSFLLHTPMLGRIVSLFKKEFDFVLVDTPPMLLLSDARVITRHSDAAIVVARCGQTPKEALCEVLQRFASDGVRVQGLIFNDWRPGSNCLREYKYYRARA